MNSYTTHKTEVYQYVEMMKKLGIKTIVRMNQYLTNNKLWGKFQNIKRMNEFESGFKAVGISSEAYRSIMELFKVEDNRHARLIHQIKI